MNDKTKKIIYWISTGLMCAIFLFSATMYFTKTEMVRGFFEALSYPSYLVYPLAIAKILGIIAVLSNKSKVLKEWAYAGFFFDATLATAAHLDANDGAHMMAIGALIVTLISRVLWKKQVYPPTMLLKSKIYFAYSYIRNIKIYPLIYNVLCYVNSEQIALYY